MATKTRWLSAPEQQAWRSYLHMTALLNARLHRDLQTDSGLSLSDFAVLVELSENPQQRVRVLELARALRWEKSRLSHQLARMEKRGLLDREECEDDRRGAWVVLTEAGRAAIVAAAPMHVASVRRYMFDVLTRDQIGALGEISDAVIAKLRADDE